MSRPDLLVSSWCKDIKSIPASYVMPPENRVSHFTTSKDIPLLDLSLVTGHGRSDLIATMIKSCQEFGLFQVINHGVSEDLMHETMKLYEEFFNLPIEEKENLLTEDFYESVRLYTSGMNYHNEEFHLWKDTLKHLTYPLEEVVQGWPEKPARYREILAKYSDEVRKMSSRILDLICEGLGLEEGYFKNDLTKAVGMVINYYPPCPEPNLALGMHPHCDPYILTMLHQAVYGLQIRTKDGQWLGVEPIPNAFVIMVPYQLQVISNNNLRSCEHRGVTNTSTERVSIVTFVGCTQDCMVGPAKEHVSNSNPAQYKEYKYSDFQTNYLYHLARKDRTNESVLGPYMM